MAFISRVTHRCRAQFKVSYVDAHDRQSDFVQGLRSALLVNGVVLTEDTTAATATVHVLDDKHVQRVLSVSPDNLPREYELTYTVRFSVTLRRQGTAGTAGGGVDA